MNTSNQQQKSRLLNPTEYHMQQLRFNSNKETLGIDPTQMLNNPHLLFHTHHQQQQESPNLSDLDYSELDNTSPGQDFSSARMYRSSGDNFIFDETSIKQPTNSNFGIQMKRSSTEVAGFQQGNHYYSQDNRLMAGSAPSNMGFHSYSSFGQPDDIISVATSQHSNTNLVSPNSNEMLNDNYNMDDFSTQAK